MKGLRSPGTLINPISQQVSSMYLLIQLVFLFLHSLVPHASTQLTPSSHVTIVGAVYCDACYNNSFSKQSYFLPGVDVHIQCNFRTNSPGTREEVSFSVDTSTDAYGIYKLEIQSVEGMDCTATSMVQSSCQASLISLPINTACTYPGITSTSKEITMRSKQNNNLCTYSLSALTYRPPTKNATLCGNDHIEPKKLATDSLGSSKIVFPPFRWPPLSQLPPLPPLPQFPFGPPTTSTPGPPASLPFPFTPSIFPRNPLFLSPPPPPAFNLADPRTWFPNNPFISQPPPPPFYLRDPTTWIPIKSPAATQNQIP